MSDTNRRTLNFAEQRAAQLVRTFEEAVNDKRLSVSLEGDQDFALAIYKIEKHLKVCKCQSIEELHHGPPGRFKVMFLLHEFRKYMLFTLESTGMELTLSGDLYTEDKLLVSNEYLYGNTG